MTAAELRREFEKLGREEQLDLLLSLWEAVAPDAADVGNSASKRQELDRRWDEYKAAPETAVPWDELDTRLAERFE